MADDGARVGLDANKGVTGALFGLAIITYGVRIYILITHKRFRVEDGMLLFAVICLIAGTGLHYASVKHTYDSIQVILHADFGLAINLLGSISQVSKMSNAASTLWWFVIVPVKLAFLFFFRRLIERVRYFNLWWWFCFIYTILAGLVCVAVSWTTCPYTKPSQILTCSGPEANARVIRNTAITTAMDISTDILVISIPIALLWRVRINVRQKIGLGVSLCLSVVMALVAIVRMAGIRLPGGAVDIVWLAFWQQQECSIAVIMVSVSAFRSLFVQKTGSHPPTPPMRDVSSWRSKLLRRQRWSDPTETQTSGESGALPQIPRAQMTGLRTMIGNVTASKMWTKDDDLESMAFTGKNKPLPPEPVEGAEKGFGVLDDYRV